MGSWVWSIPHPFLLDKAVHPEPTCEWDMQEEARSSLQEKKEREKNIAGRSCESGFITWVQPHSSDFKSKDDNHMTKINYQKAFLFLKKSRKVFIIYKDRGSISGNPRKF